MQILCWKEEKLWKRTEIANELKEEYKQYINFEKDCINEELLTEIKNYDFDGDELIITFEAYIKYLSNKKPHKINAQLINQQNDVFNLETKQKNNLNKVTVPFDLILNNPHSKIKIKYILILLGLFSKY